MNISKLVSERLETLGAKGPNQIDAVVLDSAQQPGFIVGVSIEEYNLGYSVTLRQLEVSHNVAAPAGNEIDDKLRQWTEQISQRLSYLEEPLTLLELDAEAKVAQLRSVSPHQDGEELTYWEAMVHAIPQPRVSLTRYYWSPNRSKREVAVYPVTFGTVSRIAQDIALCLLAQQAQ